MPFWGWLSDHFKGLSDLQLGDERGTLNHLECIFFLIFKPLNFPKVRLRQSQTIRASARWNKKTDEFNGPRPHADGRPGQRPVCADPNYFKMVVISGIGDSSITSENCLIGALPQARKYFEAHKMGRGRGSRRAAQRFETSSVPIKSHCWTSGVFPDRLDHLLCHVVTCSQALPHIHGRDESGRWVRADDQYRSLFNPDPSPFPTCSFPHLTLDHIRFAVNKKSPSLKRKFVFQSSIFRGYVTLRGCICLDGSLVTMHFGILKLELNVAWSPTGWNDSSPK